MRIVAIKTRDSASVHDALDKIVPLHPVLVCRAIRVIEEIGWLAPRVILQLPAVCELEPHVEADRPVVILALNRFGKRLPLRMALDAGVAGGYVIHVRGIENVGARRMLDVLAP